MAHARSTGFDSDSNHQEHARTTRLNDDSQASGGFNTLADTRLETEVIDERAGLLSHSEPSDPEAYNEASEDGNKHQAAWLEDNDFSFLPWWKRPSVRALLLHYLRLSCYTPVSLTSFLIDLLDSSPIASLYHCLRRRGGP